MPGKTNGGKDNARQTAADDPDESECKQVDDGETWYSEATERREVPKTNRRASTKAVSKCHGSQNLGFLEYPIFIEEKTG